MAKSKSQMDLKKKQLELKKSFFFENWNKKNTKFLPAPSQNSRVHQLII